MAALGVFCRAVPEREHQRQRQLEQRVQQEFAAPRSRGN
uniref:Uncharacterized protein n=1 Tax=Siphoviridae sp. cty3u30 TaxID=2825744 RepID=A0A8S5Q8I7_9CAUD|nr:MAG TPA: hypothetical protein [Siphoviridae sp. cty3u30]